MKNDFVFRPASVKDIPFLVDTIIEAEKSGTEKLTYSTIFGLSESEARFYIAKMLEEEVDGCEISVSSFIIAERDGRIAAAVGAWVEGSEGIPSLVLKGNLLRYILPSSCMERAIKFNHIIRDLHIEYLDNTIQIGLVYVAPDSRGMGLVKLMIDKQIELLANRYPGISEAYIQVFGNNIPAIKAYQKAGFDVVLRKDASINEIRELMPHTCKVLMKLNI